jgi:AraC family transcriptional regulator, transcriptional activator of pobA
MEYTGSSGEYLSISTMSKNDNEKINRLSDTTLTVIWNTSKDSKLIINKVDYLLKKNQMIFLTQFNKIDISQVDQVNIIKFNCGLYGVNQDGEGINSFRGILFFSAAQIPIVLLDKDHLALITPLWDAIVKQEQNTNILELEELRIHLKRFLTLTTSICIEQSKSHPLVKTNLDVILDFNFLVETHHKSKHKVAQYAALLNKSPKSLANMFADHLEKTPLEIIQDRIILEAKTLLISSDDTIKEMTFNLGFNNLQSFSRFFKNKEGISPKQFRKENKT